MSIDKSQLKNLKTDTQFNSLDIPRGQVRRRVGDVFYYAPELKYIIERVSPSRAIARCMTTQARWLKSEVEGEKPTPLEVYPQFISISNCCDRADVIEHVKGYEPKVKAAADSMEAIEDINKKEK